MAGTAHDGAWHAHYRAVAQPFTMFYAAWPLAAGAWTICLLLLGVIGLVFSFGAAVTGMVPAFAIAHLLAVLLTARWKFALQMFFALGNRKAGSNNLGGPGNQLFDNS